MLALQLKIVMWPLFTTYEPAMSFMQHKNSLRITFEIVLKSNIVLPITIQRWAYIILDRIFIVAFA